MMRVSIKAALLVVCFVAWTIPAHAAELKFPALTGRVVDQANILSDETERSVTASLANLEKATSNQVVVVTLPSLQGQTIEDYGYQLGRSWGIGKANKNNGTLLIVVPSERSVRIEVGYGLEGTLTDALSRGIIEREIIPKFRNSDYDGGVRAGVIALVSVLQGDTTAASRLTEAGSRKVSPISPLIFWSMVVIVLIFFSIGVWQQFTGTGAGPWSRARRRGGYWGMSNGGIGGGSSSGGGGFSGGGGSFGGGGASGRW